MKYIFLLISLVASSPLPQSSGVTGLLDNLLGGSDGSGTGLLSSSSHGEPTNGDNIKIHNEAVISDDYDFADDDEPFFDWASDEHHMRRPFEEEEDNDESREFGRESWENDSYNEGRFGQEDGFADRAGNPYLSRRSNYGGWHGRFNMRSIYRRNYGHGAHRARRYRRSYY